MWRCSSGLQDENYKSENGRDASSLSADSPAAPALPALLDPFLFKLLSFHNVCATPS